MVGISPHFRIELIGTASRTQPSISAVPHAFTPRCAPHISRNMTHVSVFPPLFPRAPWVMVRAPIFTLPGTHLSWSLPLASVTFFPISRPHLWYQPLYSLPLSSSLSTASCLSGTDCHLLLSYAAALPRPPPCATHTRVITLLLHHNTLPHQSCHWSYVVHISSCCSVWYVVD